MPKYVNIITGLVGFCLFATFIVGLSHSISTGFAGFMGGLPFMVIAIFVILLALYNLWEDTLGGKK
ncbi:MAG: hypothetical protein EBT20_15860 [Alphaproteobacteria bacterium]|mgnify:FL=1|nr:hypothetical protein [Alphaproteobacteria bacterium]NDD08253.1 hypothetical protein [Paracoccaceae bacterium]